MKIGFISTYATPTPPPSYGGEIYFWNLVKHLDEMGHEVHLFAKAGSEKPKNGFLHYIKGTAEGVIDYSKEEWVYNTYRDLLLDMDIIHDCGLDHIVAEKLRYLLGAREVINTINGHTYYMPRPPFNVVTGSEWWKEDAKRHGLNTEMIYWGTDTEFYTPGGEREDYFLWLARFHPSKGLDFVLDMAELLDIKVKIAGSMDFKDHAVYGKTYLERIKHIPNVEYVTLPLDKTHHEAKRELMRKARAFLYPVQYSECFGMVVTEAMACGCPVIATPNGAMPEIIEDGVSGFLCNTKKDFSDAVIKKIPNYYERKQHHESYNLWENAREQSLKFDTRKAAKAYDKLYTKVREGFEW